MKLNAMQQLSVLACCTGLVLAVLCALAYYNGAPTFEMWAMLLAAVAGFELFLFGQDVKARAQRRRG